MFKLQAFVIVAVLMGLGGAAYAHYLSYISPDLFLPLVSMYIFLGLLLGGVGNNYGAVLGSVIVLVLLEGSRFVLAFIPALGAVQIASVREILIASVLIGVTRFAPQGFLREKMHATKLGRPVTATQYVRLAVFRLRAGRTPLCS